MSLFRRAIRLDVLLALMAGGIVLLFLGLGSSRVHSFDVFWQLQSGRYILETFSFIHTDIFTLAADAPRFEHCWLHDVFLYLAWMAGGYSAISLLKGFILTLSLVLLICTARLRGSSWLGILCVLPLFALTAGGWLERPQLWTFLGFALFVLLLERHRRYGDRSVFWLIPAAVFWANLHAGSVLAVALFCAYLVGECRWPWRHNYTISKQAYARLWLVFGGVLLAAFLTPSPLNWYRSLWGVSSLGGSQNALGHVTGPMMQLFNMDWRLTTFQQEPWFFYVLGASVLAMLLAWRRLSLTDLCLLGGIALMGLKLSRHTSFLFLAVIAILPVYLDRIPRVLHIFINDTWKPWLKVSIALAAMGWLLVLSQPLKAVSGWFDPGLREWHYPVQATEFVAENKLPANLYNTYDWGGYMAWKLFPHYRVFWDGRQNSSEMFQLGWQVMAGKKDWEQILNRFQVKTIVTRALTIDTGQRYPLLDRLLEAPFWHLVFKGQSSMVFVHQGAVSEPWLAANNLSKNSIAEVVRSEAILTLREDPWRYKAWWELARLDIRQGHYRQALENLREYLSRTPQRDPVAENYFRIISAKLAQGREG